MKGLILAAGIGKRLLPLSAKIPKALIPIAGRPLINYILLKYMNAGIKDIGLVIRPLDYPRFKSALKSSKLNIEFIFQKSPQGTAKAVQLAKDYVSDNCFILSWCDSLTPFDITRLIKTHQRYRPSATLLINKESDPCGTAQVICKGPYITKIVEKPKKNFSYYGSSGLMVLEPEIFSVLPRVKPGAQGEYHIAGALQYLINQGKKIRFVKIDTWRVNINTLEDFNLANALISKSLDLAAV